MNSATITLSGYVFNALPSQVEPGRRAHRVAGVSVYKGGRYVSELCLDYYTPMNAPHGFYLAFRLPGYAERIRPRLRVWVGSTLNLSPIAIANLMQDTANRYLGEWQPYCAKPKFILD